ncbi:MAG: histidine kinase dimerization/phosphoacceptor domain-containing protein, partial [Kutzneria sp.]|nr:histidine kinase dimerization/phosphoacceptor domain-containing protein [Kutzneria sp.]
MTTLDAVPPPKGSAFGWWPTRRGAVLDVMIALSAAVLPMLSLLFVVALSGRSLPGIASAAGFPVRPTTGLVVRLVGQALLPLTLIARRRFPAAVAAVILAEAATLSATVDLIVAMYTLAAYGTSRRVLVGLSVLAPVAVTRPWRWLAAPNESLPVPGYLVAMFTVINILVVVVVPVMIGLYVSARRRRLVALRDRADRLEREQVLLEQQARAEERTRIAREMHDVLAHQVSLMVVNAGALEMAADKQPDRVGDAASRIADIGRTALGELRQIVGVLKEDDIGDAPPLAPQPTLADLDALVEQSRSVGVPVIVRVEGVRRRLDNVVERTAYR